MNKPVCIGKIVGVHGIKGAMKVMLFLNNPRDILQFNSVTDKFGRSFVPEKLIEKDKKTILMFTGITDRTTAETFIGTEIFVPDDCFPKLSGNEFYTRDLVGCSVLSNNQPFGTVTRVDNFGASDILTVQKTDGGVEMYSFSDTVFPVVDIENKLLVINPPHLTGGQDED